MTARLRLLCHAATAATRASAFAADEAVEAGEHARIKRLPRPAAGTVLTSPARAARDTAEILGLAATPDARLADLDVGRWRGRGFDAVLAEEPDAVALWMSDPAAAPHGGESLVALIERAGTVLAAATAHRRLLAITHAAVLRAAVVHVLGAPAKAFWSIEAAPLAFVDFSHDGRRWQMRLGMSEEGKGESGEWRVASSE